MLGKNNNKKSYILVASFCALGLLCSILYLGYTLLFCKDQTNNLFLIISSFILFIFMSIFSVASLITKVKIKNIMLSIASCIMVLFIAFNILSLQGIIKLPTQEVLDSLVGKNINEVLSWGKNNNITINMTYEYSDTIIEYNIISQDVFPNTLLKKVKEINVVVSSGPNYDKKFILQSLVGLNIDDALKIINNNFMNNVEVSYELNDEIDKDIIISQNINGEIKRNDLLKLVVSLGKEEDLMPITIIDLKGKSLSEAKLYLDRYGIKYNLEYEFSSEIKRGYCISQSEKAGTVVKPNEDEITLVISKGKEINVPDFTTMNVEEATNWITENNLKLVFKEAYDNEIIKGNIISSNYKTNDKVEEGTSIELVISKGNLKMEQFNSIGEFRSWASSLGLEYEENSEFNDSSFGTIISITPKVGEVINLNEKIKITYSKGKSTTIPNFYNKSKTEANSLCSSSNLKCYFSYKYSSSIKNDYVISQSMSKNSVVAVGTSITIYLSKGPEPKPVTCDKSITETVYLTSGNDGAQTKTIITKSYPNVKFSFKFVDKCSNGSIASGTICNAPQYDGKKLNHCDTYTLEIVE